MQATVPPSSDVVPGGFRVVQSNVAQKIVVADLEGEVALVVSAPTIQKVGVCRYLSQQVLRDFLNEFLSQATELAGVKIRIIAYGGQDVMGVQQRMREVMTTCNEMDGDRHILHLISSDIGRYSSFEYHPATDSVTPHIRNQGFSR